MSSPGDPPGVCGIGVDAVDIDRFRRVLERRPSLASRTTVAPRVRTSATLAIIFSHSGVRVATATTTVPGSMRAMGPCLSSPAG